MGETTYQLSREKTYPLIKVVNGDQSKAFKSHAKSKSHNDNTSSANQITFITENGKSQLSVPTKVMFSSKEQVLGQKFYRHYRLSIAILHLPVHKMMGSLKLFPNSKIAQSYLQGLSKG